MYNRSCCCWTAPPPPSTLRAGSSTGFIALETLRSKMVGFFDSTLTFQLLITVSTIKVLKLSCWRSDGQPGGAHPQHHWSKDPWVHLQGRDQAHVTDLQMSDQAPGGRPRSRSRSEDLQYLALIQVQLVQKWKAIQVESDSRWLPGCWSRAGSQQTSIYLSRRRTCFLRWPPTLTRSSQTFDPIHPLSFCFVIILQPLTIWSQIFSGGLMAQSILSYSWYMTTYTLNLYSTFQY